MFNTRKRAYKTVVVPLIAAATVAVAGTGPIGAQEPENHTPVAVDDTFTTLHDQELRDNVFENDYDEDGDIFVSNAPPSFRSEHGRVSMDQGSGDFTYTPDSEFVGKDTFEYLITDDGRTFDEATVVIWVDPDLHQEPIAFDDEVTVVAGESVTIELFANDVNPDGTPFSGELLGNNPPSHGDHFWHDATTGLVTYTPDPGFVGVDQFDYGIIAEASPTELVWDDAVVTITVIQADDEADDPQAGSSEPTEEADGQDSTEEADDQDSTEQAEDEDSSDSTEERAPSKDGKTNAPTRVETPTYTG